VPQFKAGNGQSSPATVGIASLGIYSRAIIIIIDGVVATPPLSPGFRLSEASGSAISGVLARGSPRSDTHPREIDRDRGASCLLAFQMHMATKLMDKARDHRQT
jgi:hypothetical protein